LYRQHDVRGAFEALIRRHESALLIRSVELVGDGSMALTLFKEVITEAGLRISALRNPAQFSDWLIELARQRAERASRRKR
jgi:hypothetical protein